MGVSSLPSSIGHVMLARSRAACSAVESFIIAYIDSRDSKVFSTNYGFIDSLSWCSRRFLPSTYLGDTIANGGRKGRGLASRDQFRQFCLSTITTPCALPSSFPPFLFPRGLTHPKSESATAIPQHCVQH